MFSTGEDDDDEAPVIRRSSHRVAQSQRAIGSKAKSSNDQQMPTTETNVQEIKVKRKRVCWADDVTDVVQSSFLPILLVLQNDRDSMESTSSAVKPGSVTPIQSLAAVPTTVDDDDVMMIDEQDGEAMKKTTGDKAERVAEKDEVKASWKLFNHHTICCRI